MTVRTFYRLSVWLPLVIPGVVAFVGHGLGVPIGVPGVGMLLASDESRLRLSLRGHRLHPAGLLVRALPVGAVRIEMALVNLKSEI
jgi:hypothetical protein